MTDYGYVHRVKAGAPGNPIFFVFHGTGGDERQFFDFGGDLLADATIVSPRGDVSEHGAARFFRRTAEGVYDMTDLARATTKMAEFVARLAAEHEASDVIGLGFSNGANILANLLIETSLFNKSIPPASAHSLQAEGQSGACRKTHPHHRRPARPDLPGAADTGPCRLFYGAEGGGRYGMAHGRA